LQYPKYNSALLYCR